MLTHRERLLACLGGQKPDRTPVALWRHFPVDDQTPETLAAATLNYQRTYDFDLVKVTPASSFSLKDWGAEDVWEGHTEGTRRYTRRVVTAPEDWAKLPMLDSTAPHLADQVRCLTLLRAELGADTPIIQTVFSPLSQAKNLAGGEKLIAHIRQHPELVKHALGIIAETTRRFIQASLATGIDGIFYAVQHAQAQLLTPAEFADFGVAYDIPVLEAAAPGWLNMLHLHGENVHFELVADYPVQIINWHDRDTAPSLSEAKRLTRAALCGGLRRETMALGTPGEIQREAADAIHQTDGLNFILGTGCVVDVIAPHGNLMAAKTATEAAS
jgi:uroporphyrinogen decarboxylase